MVYLERGFIDRIDIENGSIDLIPPDLDKETNSDRRAKYIDALIAKQEQLEETLLTLLTTRLLRWMRLGGESRMLHDDMGKKGVRMHSWITCNQDSDEKLQMHVWFSHFALLDTWWIFGLSTDGRPETRELAILKKRLATFMERRYLLTVDALYLGLVWHTIKEGHEKPCHRINGEHIRQKVLCNNIQR
jgi:hypothetical protein